ncbi:MAG: hypothetical protein KGJ78_18145, partial [Alphaproteobacteria bacterium]|nr:hypothetical protein [Alphaproteobacteria bacterium]
PTHRVPNRRGAPLANRNALKHGRFTRERRALYAAIRDHIRRSRELIEQARAARPAFPAGPGLVPSPASGACPGARLRANSHHPH